MYGIRCLILWWAVIGTANAEPHSIRDDGQSSSHVRATVCDSGRTGLKLWGIGAALRGVAVGFTWLRLQSPGLSEGARLSLGWSAGLVGVGGLTLVHLGTVRALRNAKASVPIRSSEGESDVIDRTQLGWNMYAGSYLLPLIRPISVYLAHEQLVELEERCTPFRI